MHPAIAGLRAQWKTMGEEFPPLMAVCAHSPQWCLALVHAAGLARGSARAEAALGRVAQGLSTIVGHPAPRWPGRRGAPPPVVRTPDLPALDPSQHLLLWGGMPTQSPRTCAALAVLLQTAFGPRVGHGLPDELRVRLCEEVLPVDARGRWEAGLGLMPPDVLTPVSHGAARRLLREALGGGTPAPVEFDPAGPLRVAAALDLMLTGLTVAAALAAVDTPAQSGAHFDLAAVAADCQASA